MDEITQADNVAVENITTAESPANSQTGQVVTPTTDTNDVADITTTQAFSQRLKESTQKAIDAEYSRLYGSEYGIHTKADYDTAVMKQQQEEEAQRLGLDPEAIKPFFDSWKQNDPDFQELNSIRAEKNVSKALTELNNELKENGIDLQLTDLSDTEVAKLPNVAKVTELVGKGHSLADAVFLANKKDFIAKQAEKAQQDTVKKIAANGASSPGSLLNNADVPASYTMEQINAMSQAEINKNYHAVMQSYKKHTKGG